MVLPSYSTVPVTKDSPNVPVNIKLQSNALPVVFTIVVKSSPLIAYASIAITLCGIVIVL